MAFEDGELIAFSRRDDRLTVRFKDWKDEMKVIEFTGVLASCDLGPGDVSDLIEKKEGSELFSKALDYNFEQLPIDVPFRSFCFLDLDGGVRLEIIASTFEVV